MAADGIGVPLEHVSVPATDTLLTPYNGPVASSRTTYHMGNAILAAAADIRSQILALAGEFLEVEPEILDLRNGWIHDDNDVAVMNLKELLGKYAGGGVLDHGRIQVLVGNVAAAEGGSRPRVDQQHLLDVLHPGC